MSMMFPPDMQAALMGGAAPQPAGGEGPFPGDIMAALGGGGAPPEEAGGAPLPSEGAPGGGGEALEQVIALLDDAIMAEADQEDQNVMRQCSAKLQAILAKNQKEDDAALGGTVSPRAIRRQASGGGGEGGY